jgi:hypothetical protein
MSAIESLKEGGTLATGVVVDGVRHRAFELRLPTVADNIDAVDEVGSTNGVALGAAILACQLVKLGTLKPEQINLDLLTTLHPSDFNRLEAAASELEKKRQAAAQALPTTGEESVSH